MKFLLPLFFLALSVTTMGHNGNPRKPAAARARVNVAPRLFKPLALMGRCSGEAYCTACSNCSHCGHCAGGGGTCGVCAPAAAPRASYSRPRSSTRRVRSYSGSGRQRYFSTPISTGAPLQVTGDYYVSASTLNLREEPTAESAVVAVLSRDAQVTVQELTNDKWVKVSVTTSEGEKEGYLSRAYLSESMASE